VSLSVLDKDEATNGKEIKGGSITSSVPVKGVSIVELISRGKKD